MHDIASLAGHSGKIDWLDASQKWKDAEVEKSWYVWYWLVLSGAVCCCRHWQEQNKSEYNCWLVEMPKKPGSNIFRDLGI